MTEKILQELIVRRKRTGLACSRLKEKLKHAPYGRLRVVTKKGRGGAPKYQYYVSYVEGDTNGRYLSKSEERTAAAIAQRDYERALLEYKQKELAFLDKAISGYVSESVRPVYDALLPGRRRLVTPENAGTAEQAVASWKKKRYKENPFPEKPSLMTKAGVPVRSKSEALIADALHQAGLPFRYEYPIRLLNDTLYYADFFILNPATGREFVWEHFGCMDKPDYCAHTIKKINDYICYIEAARAGLLNADCAPCDADKSEVQKSAPFSFLMTFEDKETKLQSQQIEAQIVRILAFCL